MAAGAQRPAPPLEWEFTALATTTAPPAVTGFEIRRIENFVDYLVGLEIALSAEQYTDEARAHRRAEAEESATSGGKAARRWSGWHRSTVSPSRTRARFPPHRLAARRWRDAAERARAGVAYRALTAARWDEAVARGTPALMRARAGHLASCLERCGFEVVCTMYEVEHDPL